MNYIKKPLFSNFKYENWKNLIIAAIICFYFIDFIATFGNGEIGSDYLGYWSVGKIADEKGYSEIYDFNILKSVQLQGRKELGFPDKINDPSFSPIIVPYFSFFVLPFQLISRIGIIYSFWTWTIINLIILIGYLVYFIRRTIPESDTEISGLKLLILMLISWPVFFNIVCGQIEVFLLICTGEFLRNAVLKKPVLSGIWLGGLLLKPQLLIIIVAIFLIMRNWKVLAGFIASSGIIVMTSLLISGFDGMKALINLWTKFSDSVPSFAPQIMINWRMIGLNLNNNFNTSFGWAFTGLGIFLTIAVVYFMVKQNPPFGSPKWVMVMLGVFSATLAITWHSHYHMAMILIPFLIYASINRKLPEGRIFFWVIATPVATFGMLVVRLLILVILKVYIEYYDGMAIGLFGFIVNLAILISTLESLNNLNLSRLFKQVE